MATIRHYVSGNAGDLVLGTADSGTSTTLVDTSLLKANDYYNHAGYRCYIYDGTNEGEEREVSDWTLATPAHTLTLDPAYTAEIDSTSKYELHNIFTEGDYRRAINLAIESGGKHYLIDLKDETTIVLVADTYEYSLPTSMMYIHRIITEETAGGGVWENVGIIDPREWSVIRSYPPKLKLDESHYGITAGKDLRLEGQMIQDVVDDDDDIIALPPEWLIYKAIGFLPTSKIESNKLQDIVAYARAMSLVNPISRPYPFSVKVME